MFEWEQFDIITKKKKKNLAAVIYQKAATEEVGSSPVKRLVVKNLWSICQVCPAGCPGHSSGD